MNRQEVFDKVAKHLMDQGKKAFHKGACAYRTPEGKKCAIGCLIPDEIYNPDMERKGVIELFNKFPEVPKALGAESAADCLFLSRLQCIHDMNPDGPDWQTNVAYELRGFAAGRALSIPDFLREVASD